MTQQPVDIGADDKEICEFHYGQPEYQEDASPVFARMLDKCPVAWSNQYEGFWMLSKYEDVLRAYHDTNLFSSYPNVIPAGGMGNDRPSIPTETDPPEHTLYRKILMPLFTPSRLRPLEEQVRAHSLELIDKIAAQGECEFVSEFAQVMPTRIFLAMMGWPLEHAPLFLDWTEKLLRESSDDPDESLKIKQQTAGALIGYFINELDKRDAIGPPVGGDKADFVDWLRAAKFGDERPLTREEMLDCIFIVLVAGLDTVQAVLSLSIEYLANNDEHRRWLVDNPDKIDTAVEEMLRAFAPVLPGRRLTQDLELRGVKMKAEDRVMLMMASANRDPDEFDRPNEMDFERSPNRHIAFGAGAHRCLGAYLARAELRIAIGDWLKRFPDFAIKEGTTVTHHLSAVKGVTQMHLTVREAASA